MFHLEAHETRVVVASALEAVFGTWESCLFGYYSGFTLFVDGQHSIHSHMPVEHI